jgi:tRNA A37 methylthiotransferase MiaB
VSRSVALVTLGCGRNEVDSEELAARLEAGGWELTDDPGSADAVLVNTCGFIEAAKRDSIDTLLDAADGDQHVVAVGCLAERYGEGLAKELPEVSVLGFDDYASIAAKLDDIVAGRAHVSHQPRDDIVAEAQWLADHGVRELVLVSENSTSYGKDLGDLQALERLLPRLAEVDGVTRVRVSYLQPAEVRPTLLDAIAGTPGVAAYFDVSFQHAAEPLLRRMRRFGGTDRFLDLIGAIRERVPAAGVRSNFIVGFPGETESDVAELERFLTAARLDAVGVFGYSDEEGTEGADLPDKVPGDEIGARVERVTALAEELIAQRAGTASARP